MFWGLIMEPGRCYTQTVKVSFHVSMAALDISNSSDEPTQIMCLFEGRNYLLCTLNKDSMHQCALDLNFEVGSKVSFATNGKSHVHLTGYLIVDDEFGNGLEEAEEEEIEEEEEQQVAPVKSKATKRAKKLAETQPSKKIKTEDLLLEEEESSDSDFDLEHAMEDSDEDAEEEDSDDQGEEQSDDDEASSLSGEEGEEEEEEEEEEKTKKVAPKAAKQNGVAKKEKNKEQQQPKPKKQTLKGGVIIEDLKEGTGDKVAKPGKFVNVYYEGRFKDNNKMFDSVSKGSGFSFRLGKGEVIKGWDIGVAGMKVGGKRRIICPANVAYGAKGSPPVIPPNATLTFVVELRKVN